MNVNPYQSPSASCPVAAKHGRVCAWVLGVVLLNVALNANNVVKNWPELTLFHHLIGVILWFILPSWAVFLLWRGRRIGRWILIGLFGLRAVGDLVSLGMIGPLVVHDPYVLVAPYGAFVLETLFYFSATTWLVCSPSIRSLGSRQRPTPFGDDGQHGTAAEQVTA